MTRLRRWALVTAGAALAAACATQKTLDVASEGDGGADAAATTDAAGPGADARRSGDGGFGAFGDACSQPPHCSADLHSVIDCTGHVVQTCAPDQGCAPGMGCIGACNAATANKSSIGCDYYAHDPHGAPDVGCYAAYIANTWGTPVSISAEAAGVSLDVTSHAYLPSGTGTNITYTPLPNGQIPAGSVAILFLRNPRTSQGTPCPEPALSDDTAASAWTDPVGTNTFLFYSPLPSIDGQALHLTTSAPVVAYDILPYGGGKSETTGATLLLPTSTWDTNYVAVTPTPGTSTDSYPSGITIIAQQDDTDVTLLPPVPLEPSPFVDSGFAQSPKNTPVTFHVMKGQTLLFEQTDDLLGTVVQSTKPVGVWADESCMTMDELACDGAHQQIPPVRALGSEYVGVRYRNRIDGKEEASPWRLVGMVDGTNLTYEPQAPPGAPTTLGRGQAAIFRTSVPFVVRSQDDKHPFYANAYMTGGGGPFDAGGVTYGADGGIVFCDPADPECFDGAGDPEYVNVVPAAQFMTDYVFFTDPTYPETDLVFVRAKGSDGAFHDVSLDCAGVLGGWQPVGTSGTYEYTRFDLVRHAFAPQGACDNGRHEAKSDGPFGLTVWGWGTLETGAQDKTKPGYSCYVSYAYPAGASVQPINPVVVPPTTQ